MYSCFYQTGQYIIPYHIALAAGNGQKDRLEFMATARVAMLMLSVWLNL